MSKQGKAERTNFFYFISQGKFCIADLEYCAKTDRTIDIPLFDLANNEKLLSKLNLYYMNGNYGVKYTYQSRAHWFCGYLAAFIKPEYMDEYDAQYKKSATNPTIRLLIEDEKLFEEIKSLTP